MLVPDEPRERVEGGDAIRVYGLTGGTGSGKTEVARVLADSGIPVIEADRLGHELIKPGGEAAPEVVRAFGDRIVTAGAIDREKLGALVFGSTQARETLNRIVHPMIRRRIEVRVGDLAAQGRELCVIDAALIAEDGRKSPFLDGLIVVHSDETTRVGRLIEQRGWTREQALQRLAAQTAPEQKLPLADWVIENDGTLEELREQAVKLAETLRRHATESA